MNRAELREQWRLAAIEAEHAEDRAARYKQGREIFLDELIETLIEQSEAEGDGNKRLTQARAERIARTSQAYKNYLRKMHDARLKASLLRVEEGNKDRVYYSMVSAEARERSEMNMTRG